MAPEGKSIVVLPFQNLRPAPDRPGDAAHEKPLALSGAVACDAQALPILIGLGISELVVAPAAVPMVKFQIRGLTMESCRSLAQQALGLATAGEVRALANSKIKIDT